VTKKIDRKTKKKHSLDLEGASRVGSPESEESSMKENLCCWKLTGSYGPDYWAATGRKEIVFYGAWKDAVQGGVGEDETNRKGPSIFRASVRGREEKIKGGGRKDGGVQTGRSSLFKIINPGISENSEECRGGSFLSLLRRITLSRRNFGRGGDPAGGGKVAVFG